MIGLIIGSLVAYIGYKFYNVLIFGIGFYFFFTGLLKVMIV